MSLAEQLSTWHCRHGSLASGLGLDLPAQGYCWTYTSAGVFHSLLEDLDASMATDWSDFCRVTDSDFTTMCTCKDARQSFYFERNVCLC